MPDSAEPECRADQTFFGMQTDCQLVQGLIGLLFMSGLIRVCNVCSDILTIIRIFVDCVFQRKCVV